MGQEIELKLKGPSTSVDKAMDLRWLRRLACGPAKREQLSSVYFDTPKLKLRERGVALRIRHIGKKRVQTIKAVQKRGSRPLSRDEWEQEITGAEPDLKLAKGTAFAPLVSKKLRRKLRPVFETVVERMTLPLHIGMSDVEIAADRGYIRAGRDRDPISEIELELKRGDPADLVRIAERLAHSLPVAYGARPKQDRGYALVGGELASAVRAAKINLDPQASTADAFRAVALACLGHALANERSVRGGDPEGIHQMRVGLRRLRAALSLFKPLIDGAETEAIKAELKWLAGQLAPARDFDVLVTEGIRPLRGHAPAAGARALTRHLESKRNQGFIRARATVKSHRFRNLGIKTTLWIIDGRWRRRGDRMARALRTRPAAEFAAEVLVKRLKKILKKGRRIESLDPRSRHKLRIAVKKLRYATDFFAGLFRSGKRQRTRLGKQLKALQSALGKLNDIDVHKRVAGRIARRGSSSRRAGRALAMGFVAGYEQTEIEPCIGAVVKSVKRLARESPFWR